MKNHEALERLGQNTAFNMSLVEELLKFTIEVYRRALLGEAFDGVEKTPLQNIRAATEEIFGMRTEVHGQVRPCGPEERMVWIGNHPSYETQWITMEAMSRLAGGSRGIGKKELLYNPRYLPPLLAWTAWLANMAAFVSRNNHEAAVKAVQGACKTILTPDSGVVLFTDKHRPTTERIKDDREKFSGIYPGNGIEEWLQYTCFPSSSGLMQVLDAIPDVRVINFTSALDQKDPNGATFHVAMKEVALDQIFDLTNIRPSSKYESKLSDRERMLRGWMLKDYEAKNAVIKGWQTQT